MSPSSFYSRVFDTAKDLGATDTQAHLAASQASQETGYGEHVVGNNYFGIKAPSDAVNAINAQTQESVDGKMVDTNASFRSFKGLEDAVAGYMATMAASFPAAWNAPTLSDAVSNLSNGILGKYATDPHYEAKVSKIANKYGDEAQANNISQDPLQAALSQPYTANGLTNGVTALTSGILGPEAVTSQSVAPTGVDAAFGANGLLSGNPQTFAGLLSTPAQNNFGDLASAGPVSAPMDVSALGQLKATTQTPASASVGLLGVAPSAENWGGLGLDAAAKATPASFDTSRFGDVQPSTDNFDTARFADPAPQSFDAARFGTPDAVQQAMATPQAINPSMPSMNSFSELAAAGPVSAPAQGGLLSAGFQSVADQANQNLASMQAQPSYTAATNSYQPGTTQNNNSFSSLASAGQFGAYEAQRVADAAKDMQAVVNSRIESGYQPTAAVPAGIQAINAVAPASSSLFSGATLGSLSAPLTSSLPTGLLSQPAVTGLAAQYQSFTPDDVAQPETSTVNIASDPAVAMPAMPAMETVSVPDQPSVAGPVNTPAVAQQAAVNTVAAFPSAPKKTGLLGGMINPSTAVGGLLGGLTAGPFGGLLGSLIGSQVAKNGGLTGLLGGAPMSINNIGAGLANTSSVYGGAPAGTQANTSNGGTVTSMGGGWTAYTSPNGVVSTEGPNNTHASYFGGPLGGKPSGSPNGIGDNGGIGGTGYTSPGLF